MILEKYGGLVGGMLYYGYGHCRNSYPADAVHRKELTGAMGTIFIIIIFGIMGTVIILVGAVIMAIWSAITGTPLPRPEQKGKTSKRESRLSTGLKLYGAYYLLGFGKDKKE